MQHQMIWLGTWGPFLERLGNFTGPELYFKIKIYGTLVEVLARITAQLVLST